MRLLGAGIWLAGFLTGVGLTLLALSTYGATVAGLAVRTWTAVHSLTASPLVLIGVALIGGALVAEGVRRQVPGHR